MTRRLVFIDLETGRNDSKIFDVGALRVETPDLNDETPFHSSSLRSFLSFIADAEFLCGHNIVHHDLKRLQADGFAASDYKPIDTLYLSPLLFPKKPYHKLLKNDKLQTEELNNPLNDCKKAKDLFYDEINAFNALQTVVKDIYYGLLHKNPEFSGFFDYLDYAPNDSNLLDLIRRHYDGKMCANAEILQLIQNYPVELAYVLALLDTDDPFSIFPPWLLYTFPEIENLIKTLRNTTCAEGCAYCKSSLNVLRCLKAIFGFDEFRTYDGEPLQEKAAQAAVDGKSLLAIFPTGGGKSVTFQLPALMAGKTVHGLTVVISPLQSLMKDQVDHLNELGISEAVAINGLLDPIERANVLERVANGSATILYISPEQLRSNTIEHLLLSRNIVRFVIDEAHCFSAWGQDFRVDYLYIGQFIKELQEKKHSKTAIPVSCFTATAKPKVISDICDYFNKELNLNLEVFASSASRTNLRYHVLYEDTDNDKYLALRNLILQEDCPTIVYVTRVNKTSSIANKLTKDGFPALPFNGQMETEDKIANQEAFIRNEIKIIVATSAFGMGVDKKDVKLVVHYDISGSLEDYVQEAGRAGRDPSLEAKCYVLYNDNDLNQHFSLLNRSKLSLSDINQIWRAIKILSKGRSKIVCSPLEIARQAGWDSFSVNDLETRVKTAISALERAEYIKREKNAPRVFATSLQVNNMYDASTRILQSSFISADQRLNASRIVKSLMSCKKLGHGATENAESRVDYIADMLGIELKEVIEIVNLMKQDGILADSLDMSAYILANDTEVKSSNILKSFAELEEFLLNQLNDEGTDINYKELNELALKKSSESSLKKLRTLVYYHIISNNFQNPIFSNKDKVRIVPSIKVSKLIEKSKKRRELCSYILTMLFSKVKKDVLTSDNTEEEKPVQFSLTSIINEYKSDTKNKDSDITLSEVQSALLFLSKIGSLKIEGGFLVTYNALGIKRLINDNLIKYKKRDYEFLDKYYLQKTRQIHIVGEFANMMVRNYEAALQFVRDYFQIDFEKFIAKYFQGNRLKELDRSITPNQYHKLFDELSDIQSQIIDDKDHAAIVVAAGPGSGKTRTLVHKLASLLLLEDVKQEQLLMLTFSRAAATEFKKRLVKLVGSAAIFVDVKTFHSFCFDLLGKNGCLEESENVVKEATKLINNGEVERSKISKTALVIDEAQDMAKDEYELVRAIIDNNDKIRLIAVGDDDQNIYEFRKNDVKNTCKYREPSPNYLQLFIDDLKAVKYEMVENYRSKPNIVSFANHFLTSIHNRMKTTPIQSVQSEGGIVNVTRHFSNHMEEAVVNHLLETRGNSKCCILTNTNEEALQILTLLLRKHIQAKLIQSLDKEFNLYDLPEIRDFFNFVKIHSNSPAVPREVWNSAKNFIFKKYEKSNCIVNCKNLINDFEFISEKKYSQDSGELKEDYDQNCEIYISDFEEFIKESKYDDFSDSSEEAVCVSTIHKAKGREFDSVYIMLNGDVAKTDEDKRKIYVGITRAKYALFIHSNTDIFTRNKLPFVTYLDDLKEYAAPSEIALYLTLKDIYLEYVSDEVLKNKILENLRGGEELQHFFYRSQKRICLCVTLNNIRENVVQLSKDCREKIEDFEKKGYYIARAEIRFIVIWKKAETNEEFAVILPNLYLRKR